MDTSTDPRHRRRVPHVCSRGNRRSPGGDVHAGNAQPAPRRHCAVGDQVGVHCAHSGGERDVQKRCCGSSGLSERCCSHWRRGARARRGCRSFARGSATGSGRPERRTRDGAGGGPRGRPGRRGRSAHNRSTRWRLHGGRHQVARLRIRRVEPRLELPRHPRVDHQLRQQPGAGVPHVPPRGVVSRDGPRLLQGRGQADGDPVPWDGRPPARGDGHLQRLLRPRAGVHPRGQPPGCDAAAAGGGVGAQRAGCRRHGPRLHQVGRCAGLVGALRRVGCTRLQDRDDAPDDAGRGGHRRAPPGGTDSARAQRAAARPAADGGDPAAGRFGSRGRSRAAARQRAEPGHRGRSRRAHGGRYRTTRRTRRDAPGTGHRPARTHELPVASPAQPEPEQRPVDCECGRHSGP